MLWKRDADGTMSPINFEPLATFPNYSQSAWHSGLVRFACEIFEVNQAVSDRWDLRVVYDHLEGTTCLAAQALAHEYAKRLYPMLEAR